MNKRSLKTCWKILIRITIALYTSALMAGCGTLSNGRGWGQDVPLIPGRQRISKAVKNALLTPGTYIPAAAALALQINDLDRTIADSAVAHTPVFGSQTNAERYSDRLREAAKISYWITALLTPSGSQPKEWIIAKAKGITVGLAAESLNHEVTASLQRGITRTRPDYSNDGSFPSGHTSSATVYATLASKNLDVISLPDEGKVVFKLFPWSFAVGTAWARVEARRHYPSDVLAGIALGHFLSALLNDMFLGVDQPEDLEFVIKATPEYATIGIRGRF